MRSATVAKEKPPTRVSPAIKHRVPWRVTHVEALPDFRLKVRFVDGLEGFVDMSRLVKTKKASSVFAALADLTKFRQVHVYYGAVTWPNEIDLAPDAMHSEIKKHGEWRLA